MERRNFLKVLGIASLIPTAISVTATEEVPAQPIKPIKKQLAKYKAFDPLQCQFTEEQKLDLSRGYGINADDILVDRLSKQIANDIDEEFMKSFQQTILTKK